MTDEIIKKVRTVFEADMSAMENALGRGGAEAYQAQQKVQGLQGAFQGLGKYIAAAVGVTAMKSLVSFTAGLETSKISMGVLLQQGDKMRNVMTPFAASMAEAEEAMVLLRQAAVDTPATTREVADSFNVLGLRARAAGMATKDLVALSANVATVDRMMGGGGVVARDIDQLMRGEAGDVGTAQLAMHKQRLATMGKSGDHSGLLKEVQQLLSLDADVKNAFGASAEGMFATLQDQWDQFKAEVGKPLMGALIEGLKDVLKWLEKNKESVAEVAQFIGSVFGGAFKVVSKLVSDFVGLFDSKFMKLVATVNILGAAMIGMFTMIAKHPVIAGLMAAVTLAGAIKSELTDTDQEKRSKGLDEYAIARERARAARSEFGQTSEEAKFWGALELAATRKMAGLIDTDEARGFADEFERVQKQLGAGFSNQERDLFLAAEKSEQARIQKAQEDAAKAMQAFADATNGITAGLAKLGLGDSVMETDAFGNATAKKGVVTLPFMSVADNAITANKVEIKQDNRGSRIALTQKITTDDPSRLAGATLVGAFVGAFARPLSANMGTGSLALTGGR